MQARQQAVSQPASLVESATSTVSVVSSALPIETVSVPRPRLGKTKHGGDLKIGLLDIRSLTSKAIIVNELITDHNIDVIGLTETWLKPDESTALNEASPPGYTSDHIPVHPAKAEVLLTFTIANFNLQKKNDVFVKSLLEWVCGLFHVNIKVTKD